jgi:hypothetical protein
MCRREESSIETAPSDYHTKSHHSGGSRKFTPRRRSTQNQVLRRALEKHRAKTSSGGDSGSRYACSFMVDLRHGVVAGTGGNRTTKVKAALSPLRFTSILKVKNKRGWRAVLNGGPLRRRGRVLLALSAGRWM